jgi:two-component system, NarL family, nitrate/nitrite response regulator NarL
MLTIELLLRSRLIKDSLSSMLTRAGFSVLDPSDQQGDLTPEIVIVSSDYYSNLDPVLSRQQRGAKIVVLTREPENLALSLDEIVTLNGVLTYDLSANTFVQSLRLICTGERVFPRDVTLERSSATQASGAKPSSDDPRLSPREREVLLEVVEGLSNKVIAHHLGMTEATVKVHLKSILRKINVFNRTQAAIWALANVPDLKATRAA